jgi:multidrug efflux system membrane fusion protein
MRLGSILGIALLALGGVAGGYWLSDATSLQSPQHRAQAHRGGYRDGPVPVTVEAVKQETVPVLREGIGNVQALYAVTLRSQIDGRLISVEFTEGQEVRKGDILARIDPTVYQAQYDQAVARKAQDVATLSNARIDLQRYQKLAETHAGPQQQADQQAAQVAQLEAQVKSDEAAIANAKAYLDYTVIASPIDGRIGLRLVDPGNVVHANDGSGLVLITQVRPIAVVFTLPQRDLPVVSAALARGSVRVEVLENGRSVVAVGTLQTLDNQIDVTTGTIKLKAVFANADDRLWPGQFVSTRVVVDRFLDAKVVPARAIRRGPSGTFVYAVGEDSRAAVQTVEVLLQDEARAVIGRGINVGSLVVTVGFAELADKKPVRIVAGEEPATPSAIPEQVRPGSAAEPARAPGREPRHRKDGGSVDHGSNRRNVMGEAQR